MLLLTPLIWARAVTGDEDKSAPDISVIRRMELYLTFMALVERLSSELRSRYSWGEQSR